MLVYCIQVDTPISHQEIDAPGTDVLSAMIFGLELLGITSLDGLEIQAIAR